MLSDSRQARQTQSIYGEGSQRTTRCPFTCGLVGRTTAIRTVCPCNPLSPSLFYFHLQLFCFFYFLFSWNVVSKHLFPIFCLNFFGSQIFSCTKILQHDICFQNLSISKYSNPNVYGIYLFRVFSSLFFLKVLFKIVCISLVYDRLFY